MKTPQYNNEGDRSPFYDIEEAVGDYEQMNGWEEDDSTVKKQLPKAKPKVFTKQTSKVSKPEEATSPNPVSQQAPKAGGVRMKQLHKDIVEATTTGTNSIDDSIGVIGSSIGKSAVAQGVARKRNVASNNVGSRRTNAPASQVSLKNGQVLSTGDKRLPPGASQSNQKSQVKQGGQAGGLANGLMIIASKKENSITGSNKVKNRRTDQVSINRNHQPSTIAKSGQAATIQEEEQSSFKNRTLRFTNNNFLVVGGAGVT